MPSKTNIAVIGAGVVGLSTAVNLQKRLGNECHVTVIADKFFEETTSYGAAGIFKPKLMKIPGVSEEKARKWIEDGWDHYSSLATGPEADESGVIVTSGYLYFNDAKEVATPYDVIVNCSASGSKTLCNDDKMYQIRGHLIRVKGPWLKRFVHSDNQYHAYPVREGVVVGGIRQFNDNDATPREEDREHILSRVCELVPSLKGAEIIEEWVGFRPCRSAMRIEAERKTVGDKGKPIWIVHNYGHGVLGVAISWGTAISTCKLIQQILSSSDLKSKL